MSQKVQILVLCEDGQTASFALRYLKAKGFNNHKIRILVQLRPAPPIPMF